MSDNLGIRPLLGNSRGRGLDREREVACPGRKRLVEECEIVSVYAVQRAFGKKALMTAIREARPFRLRVPGGYFDLWLVDEVHRLPGRMERWSSFEDGTARLWLICPQCRKKVAKLFFYTLAGSTERSNLACRACHRLAYLSGNSGGNRWYRETARPIRRLVREKDRLLSRPPGPRVQARLAQVNESIEALACQLHSKVSAARTTHRRLGVKRKYRDIGLLGV